MTYHDEGLTPNQRQRVLEPQLQSKRGIARRSRLTRFIDFWMPLTPLLIAEAVLIYLAIHMYGWKEIIALGGSQ